MVQFSTRGCRLEFILLMADSQASLALSLAVPGSSRCQVKQR